MIYGSSPSSSAEAPEERLGSSRCGTSRLRDFHSIKFRPADSGGLYALHSTKAPPPLRSSGTFVPFPGGSLDPLQTCVPFRYNYTSAALLFRVRFIPHTSSEGSQESGDENPEQGLGF